MAASESRNAIMSRVALRASIPHSNISFLYSILLK